MKRVLLWAALAALGCESPPEEAPAEDPTEIVERSSTTDGPLSVSIRHVTQPGWTGRLVVVTLQRARGRSIRVVPSQRPRPLAELIASRSPAQPFAAICGGFYDASGVAMGLVRSGGVDLQPLSERGGSGVFGVWDGAPRIVPAAALTGEPRAQEAIQSIDRLVVDGRSVIGDGASDRRAARSAIALTGGGDIRLAVAFSDDAVVSEDAAEIALGTATARSGPTIAQWAALLRRPDRDGGLGARDALNLDGGFSTSLLVKSETRALRVVAARATINAVLVSFGGRE